MNGFLVDTNVVSEFNRRGVPDPGVRRWLEAADPEFLYVSVLTLGEIRLGIELLQPGERRNRLEWWLAHDLLEWFEGRILPVDEAVAGPLSMVDALLAATALRHDLTVVSRNVGDFAIDGLKVVNPWES
jgi:predicted nucleic acid-binding protein